VNGGWTLIAQQTRAFQQVRPGEAAAERALRPHST
jgi:hypothetical protein